MPRPKKIWTPPARVDTVARRPLSAGDFDALSEAYENVDCDLLERQAELHDKACSGVLKIGNVHDNWFFLAWHRCFVYFHERILSNAIRDPSKKANFRVPYWDWDAGQTHIPDAFLRDPLKARRRKGAFIVDLAVSPQVIHGWTSPASFRNHEALGFGGAPSAAGAAPGACHSSVHSNIGLNFALVSKAARDPLFFCHHANIDRFWIAWEQANPNDKECQWLDQTFDFVDFDGSPRTVRVGDFTDPGRLGYKYEQMPKLRLFDRGQTVVVTSTDGVLTLEEGKLGILRTNAGGVFLHLRGIALPDDQDLFVIAVRQQNGGLTTLGLVARGFKSHHHSHSHSVSTIFSLGADVIASLASNQPIDLVIWPVDDARKIERLRFTTAAIVIRKLANSSA